MGSRALRRRIFLCAGTSQAGAALVASPLLDAVAPRHTPGLADLRRFYPDLARHFVFEYYPLVAIPGFRPLDLLNMAPAPRHREPLRAEARTVRRAAGVRPRAARAVDQGRRRGGGGALVVGPGSWQDRAVSLILDVLSAHDLKATFALEPYTDDRGSHYSDDILYLLREYGEKRRWDAFLLLRNADGRAGPVFKSFGTILPETSTDCLGEPPGVRLHRRRRLAPPDGRAAEHAARGLRPRRHCSRTRSSSLARRRPASTASASTTTSSRPSATAARRGRLARGAPVLVQRQPGLRPDRAAGHASDPCYAPRDFAPPVAGLDFASATGRERAAQASAERIRASWEATLDVQLDPALTNARRGFLLVYLNSFNEWHEGHAFEPMKDAAELSAESAPSATATPSTATTACRPSPSCCSSRILEAGSEAEAHEPPFRAAGRPRCGKPENSRNERRLRRPAAIRRSRREPDARRGHAPRGAAGAPGAGRRRLLSVAASLGFLHKPKQVKEYDHWRYIEMSRGPEGQQALQLEPPYCFRLAGAGARAGPGCGSASPENAAFSCSRTRHSWLPAAAVAPPARSRASRSRSASPGVLVTGFTQGPSAGSSTEYWMSDPIALFLVMFAFLLIEREEVGCRRCGQRRRRVRA